MGGKRFQECSRVVKIFRYRWYILIPFQFVWYYLKCFFIDLFAEKQNNEPYQPKGANLFKILVGEAQGKMKWYHTSDEIIDFLNKKHNI